MQNFQVFFVSKFKICALLQLCSTTLSVVSNEQQSEKGSRSLFFCSQRKKGQRDEEFARGHNNSNGHRPPSPLFLKRGERRSGGATATPFLSVPELNSNAQSGIDFEHILIDYSNTHTTTRIPLFQYKILILFIQICMKLYKPPIKRSIKLYKFLFLKLKFLENFQKILGNSKKSQEILKNPRKLQKILGNSRKFYRNYETISGNS